MWYLTELARWLREPAQLLPADRPSAALAGAVIAAVAVATVWTSQANEQRAAIVTGSSSGIGAATATACEPGWRVVVNFPERE